MVYTGKDTLLSVVLAPVERFFYKVLGIDAQESVTWQRFAYDFLWLLVACAVFLVALQLLQRFLPFNPQRLSAPRWDTILNATVSFITNTGWQSYSSETTMSYLTRAGFGAVNFLSAAAGMSIAVAVINGFTKKNAVGIGSFWVYLVKSIIYILLPIALILSGLLLFQGSPNNFNRPVIVKTLEQESQLIYQGPVASQAAIKHLSGCGGGFYAANAAHPYENPTALTDFINLLSSLLIAAAFPFMFGRLIKNQAQGWIIFITMAILLITGSMIVMWTESIGSQWFLEGGLFSGANLMGKELRFGALSAATFADAASASTAGVANSSLGNLLPGSKLVLIFNLVLGGAVFGGAGIGFINILFYLMLTVFLIGMMTGRTPEIYGKKLGAYEISILIVVLFIPYITQLVFSMVALVTESSSVSGGSRKITEIIYTYLSTITNNGSSIAAIIDLDNCFYNLTTSVTMIIGYLMATISALAITGSLSSKKISPKNLQFPVNSWLFCSLLLSIIVLFNLLSVLPTLVLGPVLEHLNTVTGKIF
jgi:K+-transporting ATPase, KdpA